MAYTTGISRTQTESCKHKWSCGHYNCNCNSAHSAFVFWCCCMHRFCRLAWRFCTQSRWKWALKSKSHLQPQKTKPKSKAEPQLGGTQTVGLGSLGPLGYSGGPLPCLLHTSAAGRAGGDPAVQTCRPTPWAAWGLGELRTAPQPAVSNGSSAASLQTLSVHITAWADCGVPGAWSLVKLYRRNSLTLWWLRGSDKH